MDSYTGNWGDNGNGTYNNPVLPADFSDPDIIRVGSDYYLITSTFTFSPGITILHSSDLVNWEIINAAVNDLTQINPKYSYAHMVGYGRCIWAPCITYNKRNKTFYIHFSTPDDGFYVSATKDIHGRWSDLKQVVKHDGNGFGAGWNDCGVLWDDDGQGYFICTNFASKPVGYNGWLFKISTDGCTIQDAGIIIRRSNDEYAPEVHSTEAYKIFKKDGYYYIFCNGVKDSVRMAWLMRGKNMYGPYEFIPHPISTGYREPCQGNIIDIDTPDGKQWYFWTHLGQTDVDGRPNLLLPCEWINGWPKAPLVWKNIKKPIPHSKEKRPQISEDFSSSKLGKQWMWNFQPREDMYSLTARPNHLRMYAYKPLIIDEINTAGNVLLQRTYKSTENRVTIKLDISGMENGQNAGLVHAASALNTALGVCQTNGKHFIRYIEGSQNILGSEIPDGITTVYIKSCWGFDCINRFYYSFDNQNYTRFGPDYRLRGSQYCGDHVGLFCYNNLSEAGYVDVSIIS